jgi:hypothetical protein
MGIANKVSVLGVKRKKFYPPHILEDRRKQNPKATNFYFETEYDTATLRFMIERFLAAARQGVDITVSTHEEHIRAIEAAKAARAARLNPPIETEAIPEPESDQKH